MSGVKRHGHASMGGPHKSREYRSWQSMLGRCLNPRNDRYDDYGGRGIKVHQPWVASFERFLRDMGPRPPGTTLDRQDNDGDYEPGNCRWATKSQQQRNQSRTIRITFRGETLALSDWAELLGLESATLVTRIRRGWSLDRAFTQSVQGKRT